MRKIFIILLAASMLSGCGLIANTSWDQQRLSSAAGKFMTATTLTDEQIVELCSQSVQYMDSQNKIETGAYATRLNRLTKNFKVEGLALNFKVYNNKEVNAFASGDGSVRVYTGLMDLMTDDEIVAVLGHEIGHVVHKDSKNAMKKAYMASAAQDLVGAAGTLGAITSATLGNIATAYLNAQYSQKQEYAADDYGTDFAVSVGRSSHSMYNALIKLASLSEGDASSVLAQRFADHPDNRQRAERQKARAEKYGK